MIKQILFLILLIVSNNLFSQSILTRGEVYDFEIGDVFHYRIENYPGTMVQRYFIIDKQFSQNVDTVTYTVYQNHYTYGPSGSGTVEYITEGTSIMAYTNLNGPITNFGGGPYTYYNEYEDTTYIYYPDTINYINPNVLCGAHVNGYSDYPPIFESNNHTHTWGKGLGKVLDYHYDPSSATGNYVITHRRLYYYKKGDVSCGTPINNLLNTPQNQFSFEVFPNPAKEIFYLKMNPKQELTLQLINQLGQEMKIKVENTFDGYQIDTTSLANGVYYLIVTDNNRNLYTHKMVLEK